MSPPEDFAQPSNDEVRVFALSRAIICSLMGCPSLLELSLRRPAHEVIDIFINDLAARRVQVEAVEQRVGAEDICREDLRLM